VPATRIGEIVHERRRITAETALRLARYFNPNAEFWLNLQNFFDLEVTRRSGKIPEIGVRCTLRLPCCPETVHEDRQLFAGPDAVT
jgi:plasmid maintenance system antidote protein VapI